MRMRDSWLRTPVHLVHCTREGENIWSCGSATTTRCKYSDGHVIHFRIKRKVESGCSQWKSWSFAVNQCSVSLSEKRVRRIVNVDQLHRTDNMRCVFAIFILAVCGLVAVFAADGAKKNDSTFVPTKEWQTVKKGEFFYGVWEIVRNDFSSVTWRELYLCIYKYLPTYRKERYGRPRQSFALWKIAFGNVLFCSNLRWI